MLQVWERVPELMQIFGGSRDNGKTYELISRFKADPDGILVVLTHGYADELVKKENLPKDRVMTHHQFMVGGDPTNGKIKCPNFYIDEVQSFLEQIVSKRLYSNGSIKAITLPASGPPSRNKSLADIEKIREGMSPTQFAFQFPVESYFMGTEAFTDPVPLVRLKPKKFLTPACTCPDLEAGERDFDCPRHGR